jgi:ribosomal protein L11 methyltransferase
MEYYKITFVYESSRIETQTINDLLASELGGIEFESFISETHGLTAFITVDKYHSPTLKKCLNNFPLSGIRIHFTKERIKARNWNEEWEKNYFQPIRIGAKCIIRASFHPEESGFDYPIVIDPKMSFGTGNHATTRLMLNEILQIDLKNRELLDIGCGTAILSILAAQKGASRIIAIDIDEWAYNNAIENCRLNATGNIHVALGGAEQIEKFGTFDYIFANINRNILLNDIQTYAPALKKGGILFMSGFYTEDIPAIEKACNNNDLRLLSFTEQDNWAAVKIQH